MVSEHMQSRDRTGTEPIIYNIELTLADTEYSQLMPLGTRRLELQSRTPHYVRFAFESGVVASGSPYSTLKPNQTLWEDDLDLNHMSMYFASDSAGVVVELRIWL